MKKVKIVVTYYIKQGSKETDEEFEILINDLLNGHGISPSSGISIQEVSYDHDIRLEE